MPGGHPHQFGQSGPKVRERYRKHGEVPTTRSTEGPRLYVKGVFVGYKRGLRTQQVNTALLKLQNVNTKEDVDFYLGKRVAYVYRAQKKDKDGTRFRVIWGRVTRPHGSTGTVRAKFRNNLPPKAMGQSVRIMLYPSRV